MMNDDDATSKPRKLRVVHEFNFFDENRTAPRRIIRLPTTAAYANHDATLDLSAIHEFDFFDQTRAGPRRMHCVPTQEIKDEDDEPLPPFLRRIVEGIEEPQVLYLFEKSLEKSDMGRRLFIDGRGSERVAGALTEEERMKQERERFFEIRVIDSSGNPYKMRLMHLAAIGMTVVDEEWCKLVRANHLQEGVRVRGWGFRKEGKFYVFID